MKRVTLFIFFMIIMIYPLIGPAFANGPEAGTGDLVITLAGFESSNGVAKVAIVNSKENYSEEKPFKGYNFKISDNKVVETLSLPYGEYAIKVFHDENSNGELDKRIFGIPVEAYGFSRVIR